jgi:hypothetical protein|tara:strand:+ start:118 stop:1863 length:1746 start_codon:yes stop_codon:yes gene_type:complete
MFRARDPQESLWQSEFLVTPKKAGLLQRSWAEVFRNEALPLIDEERFAPMYCPDNGRPNRAVQTVLGIHILKEMFNLTDHEALEQLEFNLQWHHALRLDMEESHLPQKTLHNFRVRLMQHDGGRVAFQETTDRIIEALSLRTGKQRLDSTHIMSNIAMLTRLGIFCETIRLFLRAVAREYPSLGEGIAQGLAQRYLEEDGEVTSYEDVRSGEGRRRLAVCARDLYRLVDRFRGTAVAEMEEYRLLKRLLREQCHVGKPVLERSEGKGDGRPQAGDDDAGEGRVPIALKDSKEVRSDSLQSLHDPDATYSGHKGKGYEVQVAETCDEENATQIITHVEVTPSSGSDAEVTVPVVDALSERDIRPKELWSDTSYGSGRNGWEVGRRGTELVSPVGGAAPTESETREEPVRLAAADFQIDVTANKRTVCPAGHQAIAEYEDEDAPERVEVHFARHICEPCPLRPRCPVRWRRRPELAGDRSLHGAYVLSTDLVRVNIEQRRRAEADGQWGKRYAVRAGIEGTNSELKRRHGLGRLRVRGGSRVRLAVYFKGLACNIKRMIVVRMEERENATRRAAGVVPAAAAA